MQQVRTENHCAQGGKTCARKAGSRLAALALALAMVFTTALPAYAADDLGELTGTSTAETAAPTPAPLPEVSPEPTPSAAPEQTLAPEGDEPTPAPSDEPTPAPEPTPLPGETPLPEETPDPEPAADPDPELTPTASPAPAAYIGLGGTRLTSAGGSRAVSVTKESLDAYFSNQDNLQLTKKITEVVNDSSKDKERLSLNGKVFADGQSAAASNSNRIKYEISFVLPELGDNMEELCGTASPLDTDPDTVLSSGNDYKDKYVLVLKETLYNQDWDGGGATITIKNADGSEVASSGNIETNPKSKSGSSDKKYDHIFYLDPNDPKVQDTTKYKYLFGTHPENKDFDKEVIPEKIPDATGYAQTNAFAKISEESPKYENKAENGHITYPNVCRITFDLKKLYDFGFGGKTVTITYRAELTGNSTWQTEEKTALLYGTYASSLAADNDHHNATKVVVTNTVYSYGLDLNLTPLLPVGEDTFTLYTEKECTNAITFSKKSGASGHTFSGSNGQYYKWAYSFDGARDDKITQITANSDGVLQLYGLAPGTYYLKPAKADSQTLVTIELKINEDTNSRDFGNIDLAASKVTVQVSESTTVLTGSALDVSNTPQQSASGLSYAERQSLKAYPQYPDYDPGFKKVMLDSSDHPITSRTAAGGEYTKYQITFTLPTLTDDKAKYNKHPFDTPDDYKKLINGTDGYGDQFVLVLQDAISNHDLNAGGMSMTIQGVNAAVTPHYKVENSNGKDDDIFVNTEETGVTTKLSNGQNYTQSFKDTDAFAYLSDGSVKQTDGSTSSYEKHTNSFFLIFDLAKIAKYKWGGKTVTITYEAALTTDAVWDNPNSATLTYSKSPSDFTRVTTGPQVTHTYTYGVDLDLTALGAAAQGETFQLYTALDGTGAASGSALKFSPTNGQHGGTYNHDPAGEGVYFSAADGGETLTSSTTGTLQLYGLAPGTYYLFQQGNEGTRAAVMFTIAKNAADDNYHIVPNSSGAPAKVCYAMDGETLTYVPDKAVDAGVEESPEPKQNYAPRESVKITVPAAGRLTVTKEVTGNEAAPASGYAFTVKFDGTGAEKSYPYQITGGALAAPTTGTTVAGGTTTIHLQKDQSFTVSGLPIGLTYTVTETGAGTGSTAYVQKGGSGLFAETNEATGEITAAAGETVTFRNVYPTGYAMGTLNLTKKLVLDTDTYKDTESTLPGVDFPFSFRIAADKDNPAPAAVNGAAVAANGSTDVTVTLAGTDVSGQKEATNTPPQSIPFTFTAPGTYTFTVSENQFTPADPKYTVLENTQSFTVTYEVSMDGTGALTAEQTEGDSNLTFENKLTYVYDGETAAALTLHKTLAPKGTGTLPASGYDFTFTATRNGSAGSSATIRNLREGHASDTAQLHFTFYAPGKYTYTVTETPDAAKPEIEYDKAEFTVEFDVSRKNGDWLVERTVTGDTLIDGEPAFTNYYAPAAARTSLKLKKTLVAADGDDLPAGSYDFRFDAKLTEWADGGTPDAVTIGSGGQTTVGVSSSRPNDNPGSIDITFTHTGTYTFRVTESGPDLSGKNYTISTEAAKDITFTVTDNGSGQLVAVSDPAEVAFVNTLAYTYGAKTVTLPLHKTLTGPVPAKAGPYNFDFTATRTGGSPDPAGASAGDSITVAAGTSGDLTFTFTKPGTYTYTVTETPDAAKPEIEFDTAKYTVAFDVSRKNGVWDVAHRITLDGAEKSALDFENRYKSGELTVVKALGGPAASLDEDKTFNMTVTAPTGLDLTGLTFDTEVGGTVTGKVRFNGGKTAAVEVKPGAPVTIKGLPIGDYTVTEEPAALTEYDVAYSGSAAVDDNTTAVFTVTNTRKTGTLTVTKTVEAGRPENSFALNKYFHFKVTLIPALEGTFGGVEFTGGTGEFDLKSGEQKDISSLPFGVQYLVEETSDACYETTSTNVAGDIAVGVESIAAFTNRLKTGSLTVRKFVRGNDLNAALRDDTEFTFTVTLESTLTGITASQINGKYGDVTFKEGVADDIKLKNNGSVTASGLPAGLTFTVEETGVDGFTQTGKTVTGNTIQENETAVATFTNALDEGSLTVTKKVESPLDGDKTRPFHFTVTAPADLLLNGEYGGAKFTNGSAELTLTAGHDLLLEHLPAGDYTVAETDGDGFTTTAAVDGISQSVSSTGSVTAHVARNGNTAVVYTNTRKTGTLTLTKEVTSAGTAWDKIPANDLFGFTVVIKDSSGTELTGEAFKYSYDGASATIYTLHSGDKVFLTRTNGSLTIEDLPAGAKCTVTEVLYNSSLYTPTNPGPQTAIIPEAGGKTLPFTNEYRHLGLPSDSTNTVKLKLEKKVIAADEDATEVSPSGTHTVGLLYTWQEPAERSDFIKAEVNVTLHLQGKDGQQLSPNNGAGYVFAFRVSAKNDIVDTGSGMWLIHVPASKLNGSHIDYTAPIEVFVPAFDSALSGGSSLGNQYTVEISEISADDGASFQTNTANRGTADVTITVKKGDILEYSTTPEFTNTFSGEVKGAYTDSVPEFTQTSDSGSRLDRAYGWFDMVKLDSDHDYTATYDLPVGSKAGADTVVHIFEMSSKGYAFAGAEGDMQNNAVFAETAEGGVVTVKAGTDKDTDIGTVTITNRRDPASVDVLLQAKVTLETEDPNVALPEGNYPFTVRLQGDAPETDIQPTVWVVKDSSTSPSAASVSGTGTFTFTKAGEYTFTATQFSGRDLHIGYYGESHPNGQKITVAVGYDAFGDLKIDSVTVDGKEIKPDSTSHAYQVIFPNTYRFDTLTPVLDVSKRFALKEGTVVPAGAAADYDFTFVLEPVDPAGDAESVTLHFGTPTAAGETRIGTVTGIPFKLTPGNTAAYTLSEVKGTDDRITYSGTSYTITYTVVSINPETVTVDISRDGALLLDDVPLEALDEALLARTLRFENVYAGNTPVTPPGGPGGGSPGSDPRPDEPRPAAAEAPASTPAPAAATVAVTVPRTADDMPLGAVRALFTVSAAALAVLGAVWHRRRKSR